MKSAFIIHEPLFLISRSSFIVHRSSFIVHRSSFIVHRFLVPRFLVHPFLRWLNAESWS